jgi:hypothetical protein
MRRGLFSVVIVLVCSRGEAGCVDPASLAHSTTSITRYFADKEKGARPDVLGISGTGWFSQVYGNRRTCCRVDEPLGPGLEGNRN